MGCNEPIAIAYAASVAGKVLGEEARRMELSCSGNIIKNVKAVAVPNAGGQKGHCGRGHSGPCRRQPGEAARGHFGMRDTDKEILRVMTNEVNVDDCV